MKALHSRSLTWLTALVLCCCYTMTAALYLAHKNIDNLLLTWGQDLQMTVYLKPEASPLQVDRLIQTIKSESIVQAVRQVSAEENFNQFKRQMASMLPDLESDAEARAVVPSTLEIIFNLKNAVENPIRYFSILAEQLKSHGSVEQVSYGQLWIEKFSKFFLFLRSSFVLGAFIVLISSVFVFSNAVRAWINSKRFEIEVYELVGATAWAIRKPFVIHATILGTAAGLVAGGLIYGLGETLKESLSASEMLAGMATHFQVLTVAEYMIFVTFAAGLSLLASYLCVREINSGWAASERA